MRVNEDNASYVSWCNSRGAEACSLTKFRSLMKCDPGVEYVEISKRGIYAALALKCARLMAVASA